MKMQRLSISSDDSKHKTASRSSRSPRRSTVKRRRSSSWCSETPYSKDRRRSSEIDGNKGNSTQTNQGHGNNIPRNSRSFDDLYFLEGFLADMEFLDSFVVSSGSEHKFVKSSVSSRSSSSNDTDMQGELKYVEQMSALSSAATHFEGQRGRG
ncbi:hypothetical protein TrRE_jg4248, partial [Triparma retinervis]